MSTHSTRFGRPCQQLLRFLGNLSGESLATASVQRPGRASNGRRLVHPHCHRSDNGIDLTVHGRLYTLPSIDKKQAQQHQRQGNNNNYHNETGETINGRVSFRGW
jgi:hypothetical protein